LRFLTKKREEAKDSKQFDYGHPKLPIQFDEYGILGIEIDIDYDS